MSYIIDEAEINAVKKVLLKGDLDRYIDDGESITSIFENRFSKKFNIQHTLAVSSGTAALICGLIGLGIKPGDEIIIPSFTYVATALAVIATGAIPIVADINNSLTLDIEDIKSKITDKTKAIIPVHMHGLPCDMENIVNIARNYDLKIVEDVAQACGGSYRNQKLGTIGDVGAFSFNHYKIITCGEGGALITNNKALYQKALLYHHGGYIYESESAYLLANQCTPGINFRISEISSAILNEQLNKLDKIIDLLRCEKKIIIDYLGKFKEFNLTVNNDPNGDCARAVFIQFDTENDTKKFISYLTKKKIHVWSVLTKGHFYRDWLPILHNFSKNLNSEKKYSYEKEACNKSFAILNRTIGLSTSVRRNRLELMELLKKI